MSTLPFLRDVTSRMPDGLYTQAAALLPWPFPGARVDVNACVSFIDDTVTCECCVLQHVRMVDFGDVGDVGALVALVALLTFGELSALLRQDHAILKSLRDS